MSKNEMSADERMFIKIIMRDLEFPRIHYPKKKLLLSNGFESEVYEIPDDKKQEVFDILYPFTDQPSLDDEILDIHSMRKFKVRDFIVIHEDGIDFLASPYYAEKGGTFIDWAIPDGEEVQKHYFK